MPHTLEQFAATCRNLLTAEPGSAGREKVRTLLEQVLVDNTFIGKHLTDATGDREILYEDPELGFCILAHHYKGAKNSPPHDHGPSWAIYGQARGETVMTDYALLEPASAAKAGKVRVTKTYSLTPGIAHVYNEGDLHSPSRASSTHLIRIEGKNMDTVKRFRFEAI
jgi:predicted metal-dependent enzyme (double-stranded beta helix superfamily)